jgi:hypothetical protein
MYRFNRMFEKCSPESDNGITRYVVPIAGRLFCEPMPIYPKCDDCMYNAHNVRHGG